MNSVHAVLRNWDILQVIINFVKGDFKRAFRWRRDVVAVALVCRALSDLALNVLWREMRIENIYSLFPMDMVRVHPQGTKSLTCIPATPQEWERFDIYASRVRKLSASRSPDHLLHGVRMRYPTLYQPFPNLTCVRWLSAPSNVVDAMALICPTLKEMNLSVDGDPKDSDDAVANVLRSLGETCSRLRKFGYTNFWPTINRSKSLETSFIYLIRQCRCLEDVRLPVSRDILRALGSLSHLSTLKLDYNTWEDGPRSHLPQAEEWIEEADSFPVLTDLNIRGSHTVSSLTECFQGSGCFPRKSFTMWNMRESEQWSTRAIAQFFREILRPDRSEGLLVFRIDRATAVQNPVGHDPWKAIRPLSIITNLRTLSLDGFFLDIDDADLEEIPRIWPKLQSLSLDVPYTNDYQSQVSFRGLAHLSTLENLDKVSLMLAPDSTISESMLSPSTSSHSPLKLLKIRGKFPPVPPHAAAMFLIFHFPELKSIKTSLILDKEEVERMKEIQTQLDGVRPKMKNVPSVCRSLRNRGTT